MARSFARLKPSRYVVIVLIALAAGVGLRAQNPVQPLTDTPLGRDPLAPAPNRAPGEGFGPYQTLVVRDAMLIDGTGGPPRSPVDIVVNGNRITAIRNAGTPGVPLRANRAPKADYEIDATGMYVTPGFIDVHVHAGGAPKNPDAEYPYKLWLSHGVTTVRGVPLTDNALAVKEKDRSARNEIVAPRIFNYQRPGSGWGKGAPQTADQAHLQQTGVVQVNAIKAARMGLGMVQNYNNEQDRFGQVARL